MSVKLSGLKKEMFDILKKGFKSELKFVISLGATKERTVQVDTVP